MPKSQSVSLARQLFTMTWPMMFGVLSLMSFQLVDSAFIGQLGVLPLATQGFTLPIQMIIIGIQVGLGIATTAIISRALGAEQFVYAKQLGGLVLIVGMVGVALIGLLLWLLRYPILALLSAPDTVMPVINHYWPLWLVSSWIGATLYFFYSVCRANGNTKLPGALMVITSLINLALDPLFIFTFGLGINGAALATSTAFAIGLIIIAPKTLKYDWMSFDWRDIDLSNSVRSLLNIMGPAMTSQLLPPISSMLATKMLAGFGTAAVAAWAVGSRYEFFAIVVVLALTMSLPPMVGRSLGGKQFDDIDATVTLAAKFVFGFQLIIALLTFALAGPLTDIMAAEDSVRKILHWHLTIVPISLGPVGICMMMVSVCNALGKPYRALLISALRLFAFFLPCLWIGAKLGDVEGLLIGASIGNMLAGLYAWSMYRQTINALKRSRE
ncbi:MATE family efflux transporter [Vibrio sp. SM6]|uniref:Multidrug resistance protein NorM n=1 Tax=Vibrio agarilyticus TaxID=2726741 RepID=A0A7X8YFX9_9VIBR|nr:MATE family efflux transporter [Vibrio agarilyticus]NLS12114.1 MATE family efflux transporter [Vibrio agarilyticus]